MVHMSARFHVERDLDSRQIRVAPDGRVVARLRPGQREQWVPLRGAQRGPFQAEAWPDEAVRRWPVFVVDPRHAGPWSRHTRQRST